VNRLVVTVFAILVCLAGSPVVFAQDKAEIDRGTKVYTEQKCAVCHSIGGKGNVKGPLDSVGSRLTADEVRQWMVNPAEMTKKTKAERKPPMRAYPNLPKEDLDAVVAYMLSLKKS
jgi:mono/diheme cytochrome c family protein